MAYAKVKIVGKIETVTGLHIGGSESYSAIGAVDSPVVRDSLSGNPIIPGSSIKGKMRALLQRTFGASPSHNKDHEQVLRLFGSSGGRDGEIIPSRLKFGDCFICEEKIEELRAADIRLTEVKTENAIDRKTAVANPRSIERVIRGLVFNFELFYDAIEADPQEITEDFANIEQTMKLLENDCLGGHGSRGSGRIKFHDLAIETIYGEVPDIKLEV